jgi:hypothetical protein
MRLQLGSTLAALGALGGVAAADSSMPAAEMAVDTVSTQSSHRGVAEGYLVMPSGGEVSAQMRFVMSEAVLDDSPLRFTDLALFGLSGRWSLFSRLEVSAQADFVPKQPSYTNEKPWQSVGFGIRSPIGKRVALAISGGGGHLMSHVGQWTRESMMIEWRKPIDREFLTFQVQGGIDGLGLSAPNSTSSAFITELAVQTSALFHVEDHWGAWLGISYAVPVQKTGRDPTTNIAIDPQPRLDFHMGTVLSLVKEWDIYADFAVIDRGDVGNPATRLPILDGGFDQRQIVFGVTRHITVKRHVSYDSDDEGDALRLGAL